MEAITHYRIKKISPQLLVTDIERSIEFYTKKLGFEVDFRYEDFYCGVSKDGCLIHLKIGNPSIEERKNKRKNEDLDIVVSVDHIEDLYQEFLSHSAEFIQPLRKMDYGIEFYIVDPDGYIISFIET